MRGPLDIHQFLLAHDVHHEIVRLPRSSAGSPGTVSLAQALGLPERRCVAVHPYHAPGKSADQLALLLAPADTVVDDVIMGQRLAKALATKGIPGGRSAVRHDAAVFVPAGAELVSRRTDYLAGHLAPLLLPPDVEVAALQSLADLATTVVYTPTGDIGTALGLRALDLLVLSKAIVLPSGDRDTRRRPVRIDLNPAHAMLDVGGDTLTPAGPTGPAGPARRTATARPAAANVAPVAS